MMKMLMEKHQPWRSGWINLPIAWKFHFLEEIALYIVYYTGSEVLLKLGEDMMFAIFYLSVGYINIELLFSFPRYSEKLTSKYLMLFL